MKRPKSEEKIQFVVGRFWGPKTLALQLQTTFLVPGLFRVSLSAMPGAATISSPPLWLFPSMPGGRHYAMCISSRHVTPDL